MKKQTQACIIIFLLIFTSVSAQINTKNTTYVGAGPGLLLGGGSFTPSSNGESKKYSAFVANFNMGLNFHHSFSETFGAGMYIKLAGVGYATLESETENDWSSTGSSQVIIGLQPRFYVLNKNKISLSIAPNIGLILAKDNIEVETNSLNTYSYDGQSTGINYGASVNFNFFWSKNWGMFAEVGLNGSSHTGDFDDYGVVNYRLTNLGIAAGAGIIAKFGGEDTDPAR